MLNSYIQRVNDFGFVPQEFNFCWSRPISVSTDGILRTMKLRTDAVQPRLHFQAPKSSLPSEGEVTRHARLHG
jgi:hypothetical protein